MRSEQHGRRTPPVAVAAAVLLVLAGVVLLVVGVRGQQSPPQPSAAAAGGPAAATTSAAASDPGIPAAPTAGADAPADPSAAAATGGPGGPALSAAEPTMVDIPAIGVHSDLVQLGLNPDGTVEVPPLARDSKAGWYRYSPAPGQLGPAVLLGHVDSAEYGPGVFYRLGALQPGETVRVARADGIVAEFRVDRVVRYPKDAFPTLEVYGNTPDAQLRLITCGGDFDRATRNYLDNVVAYATLVGSHPA